jgi:hypothetical protein
MSVSVTAHHDESVGAGAGHELISELNPRPLFASLETGLTSGRIDPWGDSWWL